jgi:hypothetical protein
MAAEGKSSPRWATNFSFSIRVDSGESSPCPAQVEICWAVCARTAFWRAETCILDPAKWKSSRKPGTVPIKCGFALTDDAVYFSSGGTLALSAATDL